MRRLESGFSTSIFTRGQNENHVKKGWLEPMITACCLVFVLRPGLWTKVFRLLGHPLRRLNVFIGENL